MELTPDLVLKNRYRIIRLLGKGGMGAVHLAFDISLENEVAVKTNHSLGVESKEQFLREARLLATLRHPNLPRVIDHFVSGETQFLVMDYIPGIDLDTLVDEQGSQPLEKVIEWSKQIGSALSYLHKQDPPITHRDVKPANIKLTPEGDLILVDFGLAKASEVSQATATGAAGYSPGYSPPEQYGAGHTGPHSDQYSLAATFYKLLTNQRPVEGIHRLLNDAVLTSMRGLNPSIPPYIQFAIEKAMSVQPQDRFASISDFTLALRDMRYMETQRPMSTTEAIERPEPKTGIPKSTIMTCGGILAVIIFISLISFGAWYVFFNKAPTATPTIPIIIVAQATTETAMIPPLATTATPLPTDTPTSTPSATIISSSTPTAEPSFTPTPRYLIDERKVAFVSDRADGETLQIWTMIISQTADNEIIGLDLNQITFSEGNKSEPEWSPDGTSLLYSAPGTTGDNLQIWMLDLEQAPGEPIQITDLDGDNTNPSWSPDGSMIAFTNFGRFAQVYAIYTIDSDGNNRARISLDFQETNPTWSPDMEWLFYIIHARDHDYFFYRNKVEDYTTPVPYDPTTYFGRLGEVADPAFSMDGVYVAYTKVEGEEKQIYTFKFISRGATFTLLTNDLFNESQPAWSPDGQWIAFTSERDGNPEIYIMTSIGHLQTNLTNYEGIDMQADWQH
jgi:serine/threonine protein kinase